MMEGEIAHPALFVLRPSQSYGLRCIYRALIVRDVLTLAGDLLPSLDVWPQVGK